MTDLTPDERALDWIADARANLIDPMVTYKEDATARFPAALNALTAVLDLADKWTVRGEHLMAYSKTIPEEVGTALLGAGADFVEKARVLRNVLTAALEASLDDEEREEA